MVAGRRPAAGARRLTVAGAALLALLAPPPPGHASEPFDPDDPPETRYRLGPSLTFGAEVEIEYASRRNLDLDRQRPDDVSQLTPELSLAWSFDPLPAFQVFLNLALGRTLTLDEGSDRPPASEDAELELKEAYAWLRELPGGFSLQLGRQRFEDARQWLYDDELDAVRLRYERGALAVELSASWDGQLPRNLLDTAQQERINSYTLVGRYHLGPDLAVEGYAILRDYLDAPRRRPFFIGFRSRGEPVEDLDYWVEIAGVVGDGDAGRFGGWGLDLGATYELQTWLKPGFTAGVAVGSREFRQTGLQNNEGDFGGATDFKYYGEVLDPELGNLVILTGSLGIRPAERVSLDLVAHYYLQVQAATSLRETALQAEPSGRSRWLGGAVDLVFGVENLWNRLDARVVVGGFLPGAAFPGDTGAAWLVGATVQVRF